MALWSSAARHAAALMAGLSDRMEHQGPGPIAATADLLARAAQLRLTPIGAWCAAAAWPICAGWRW
ncbi:hypothetical protein ACFQX6_44085 [Streptosporangium lutulentum]